MILHLRCAALKHLWATIICLSAAIITTPVISQTTITLTDLSSFKNPPKSWRIAGDVSADLNKANMLKTAPGTGILVNLPEGGKGEDLFFNGEHGDIDLELDYMMAKGSNSGIYLQSRYEIQLLDSWGVKNPKSGDNGGIYKRRDMSRPEGQREYEGHAPRQNASKAPGLWQHMKISFQAPRFDAGGRKTENARIVRLELNGVTIHENVEMSGPTGGATNEEEKPAAPLRIQGDHGPVAFRNIKITSFGKPRPELSNLRYTVYKGRYADTLNINKLPPEAQGPLGNLSAATLNNLPNEYFIRYTGTLKVTEPGDYNFGAFVPGGSGVLKINGKPVNPAGGRNARGAITLTAGEVPFELLYTKTEDWTNRMLGLAISGPGIREFLVGDVLAIGGGIADPILVEAPVNTILRSFMDIPGGTRIVHAVSVGSPEQVHYTYDMDKGAILQIWRGGFLDATPMWYSRGDGSSRPVGAVQRFGKPVLALARLATADATWVTDTTGSGYTPKGYRLDKNDLPTFRYLLYGSLVEDAIRVTDNGQGLKREITVQNPSGFYTRLAEGSSIESLGNGLYTVDDKSYYVRLDDAAGAKAVVRESSGRKELLLPVQGKVSYTILF